MLHHVLAHTRTLKKKNYELTDHLGNVRSVITDMKLPSGSAFLTIPDDIVKGTQMELV